jgi:assimilatory nitrate reductase catalytic subunit
MQETVPVQLDQVHLSTGVATHCPYCALQCGMHVMGSREGAIVTGNPLFPVNKGGLCIKGWTSTSTLAHTDRLLSPLARDDRGTLVPVTWNEALARIIENVRDAQARYGKNAVGIFGGGSLTNEKVYLLGKFARVALGTSQIDYNGRFCMSSAAASIKAFGIDRGLPLAFARIPSSCPSTGGKTIGESPDQSGAGPNKPYARVQSMCGPA